MGHPHEDQYIRADQTLPTRRLGPRRIV